MWTKGPIVGIKLRFQFSADQCGWGLRDVIIAGLNVFLNYVCFIEHKINIFVANDQLLTIFLSGWRLYSLVKLDLLFQFMW